MNTIPLKQKAVLDSITKIRNKHTNEEIPIITKQIVFETAKYSSKKIPIWHICINDIKMRKTSDWVVQYLCSECNRTNEICTTQFLRKLRKGSNKCNFCAIAVLNSKPNHNQSNPNKPKTNEVKLTPKEFKIQSEIDFSCYPDEYRNSYFIRHLTEEDFKRICPKIMSICNGKYTDIEQFEFWPIYKVYNQMAFSSVLYDKINDTIIKANQPMLKCDNCDIIWRAKSLEAYKNHYKIYCKECNLCNRIFKIRPVQNILGEKIMYQSKLEKKFVDWCNLNNLVIRNGPKISYDFENNKKIYKTDFMVGSYLIEIKDFHCWHKEQVKSGKWYAKEQAAKEYVKLNGLIKFIMITPQNWEECTKQILEFK